MRKLLSLDDHTAAVELLERAGRLAPDHPGVQQLRARSEATLMDMLVSKLGDLQRRPQLRLEPDEIIWLNLDHRAGFVLAQIDGTMTFEELFAVSGMSRLDTARILAQLVARARHRLSRARRIRRPGDRRQSGWRRNWNS